MDETIISNIIEAIETGYRKANKHSEALEGILFSNTEIRRALSGYLCEWWYDE
jgi:hypothetical protein